MTGQNLSVVSAVRGTTTDPVKKAMELLPLGPVLIIDTPGIDDEGDLGALRVERTKQVLNETRHRRAGGGRRRRHDCRGIKRCWRWCAAGASLFW